MSSFYLKIVNMSIAASWLILAVLILRLVLKKAPKWVNVLLWGIAGVRLVLPFSIESAWSLIPSAETVSPEIMLDAAPTIHTGIPALNSAVNPVISRSFAPAPGDSANPLQIWIPVLAAVWLTGVAALLVYTAVSYWRLRRRVSAAVLLKDNIFQSENVASPFVLGIIKPKIYLPFKMDDRAMEQVITHETAHIRRRDHIWKPLGFLLLTVYWFNPLLWLAYVLLCRDIELACDEKVIREMDNERRADYTQALLTCSVSRRTVAACPLAFGEVGVKERVKSVMNYKKPAFWVIVLAVIACAAVSVCFLTNPKSGEPDELPLLYSHTYDVIEVTYGTSGMVVQENTPVYAISEGMRLMSKGEHTPGDEWTDLGILTETELTQENFDKLFFRKGNWFTNETASAIRKNNANAWMLVYNRDVLYYVLQQKNGDVYLAYGYYDYSEKDDPYSDDTNIRWLYKLESDFDRDTGSAGDTGAAPMLSLDDVITLSQKGHDLRWADFEKYDHADVGSGLYIWRFEIGEMFTLMIGGGSLTVEPMYIRLAANDGMDAYIDIRDGGVAEFIDHHKNNAVVKCYYFKEGSGTCVSLYDNGEFSFTFSFISSYFGYGKYEIEGGRLTLRTEDGNFVYVFDMIDDTLVFDAEASSEMTWFSELYDGAVLKQRSRPQTT